MPNRCCRQSLLQTKSIWDVPFLFLIGMCHCSAFMLSSEMAFQNTLLGTNISHTNGTFEDDFPFPVVGYVSCLEGIPTYPSFV